MNQTGTEKVEELICLKPDWYLDAPFFLGYAVSYVEWTPKSLKIEYSP